MSENTKIEWASHTFNPWIGCAKVHAGCVNCYAETMAGRLGVTWGPHGSRRRTAKSTWRQVERWNRAEEPFLSTPAAQRPRVFLSRCDPFEDRQCNILDSKGRKLWRCCNCNSFDFPYDCMKTLRRQDYPECCSSAELLPTNMNDLRRDFFALIDRTPNLDWLLLTKRPENIRRMWLPSNMDALRYAPTAAGYCRKNCWLLYSASDQQSLEAGLPHLLACRDLVPVLGLSLEPLVGPVDLGLMVGPAYGQRSGQPRRVRPDWVIVAGESGPRSRPCNIEWIRAVVRQCKSAGVPCFLKQLGANIECIDVIDAADHFPGTVRLSEATRPNARVHLRDPKGGDITEFPSDLQIREFPMEVCK